MNNIERNKPFDADTLECVRAQRDSAILTIEILCAELKLAWKKLSRVEDALENSGGCYACGCDDCYPDDIDNIPF